MTAVNCETGRSGRRSSVDVRRVQIVSASEHSDQIKCTAAIEFVHLGNLSADARVPPIGIVKYEHRHSCRPPSVKCARAFDDHVREFIRRLRVSRSHGYSGLPHSRSVDLIELIRFENPASRHAYSHALTYFQELSRFLQRRDYRGATEMDLPD